MKLSRKDAAGRGGVPALAIVPMPGCRFTCGEARLAAIARDAGFAQVPSGDVFMIEAAGGGHGAAR